MTDFYQLDNHRIDSPALTHGVLTATASFEADLASATLGVCGTQDMLSSPRSHVGSSRYIKFDKIFSYNLEDYYRAIAMFLSLISFIGRE